MWIWAERHRIHRLSKRFDHVREWNGKSVKIVGRVTKEQKENYRVKTEATTNPGKPKSRVGVEASSLSSYCTPSDHYTSRTTPNSHTIGKWGRGL